MSSLQQDIQSLPMEASMNSLQRYTFATRSLVALIFLANGLGIIQQAFPARELAEHGVPAALVPLFMLAARTIEIVGGFGLILGIYPQISAIALIAFLVPATLVGHGFWQARPISAASQFSEERCDDGRSVVHRSDFQPTHAASAKFAVNGSRTNDRRELIDIPLASVIQTRPFETRCCGRPSS
jgi:uncharacterized membrane protein YphA (DoxX/SURF4 family)